MCLAVKEILSHIIVLVQTESFFRNLLSKKPNYIDHDSIYESNKGGKHHRGGHLLLPLSV